MKVLFVLALTIASVALALGALNERTMRGVLRLVEAENDGFKQEYETAFRAHWEFRQFLRMFDGRQQSYNGKGKASLLTFSYTNCAAASDEQLVVSSLDLKPDPIKLPGNITISGSAEIKSKFGSPMKVVLTVWKEVFGAWIEVPCVGKVGSCTYDDGCTEMEKVSCPPELVKIGINCRCPFSAGKYTLPSASFLVNASAPVSGGVRVKAEVSSNSKLITCIQVEAKLA